MSPSGVATCLSLVRTPYTCAPARPIGDTGPVRVTFLLPPYEVSPVGGYRIVYEYAVGLAARGYTVAVVHDESAAFVAGYSLRGLARARHRLWTLRLMARALPTRRRTTPVWVTAGSDVQVMSIAVPMTALLPAADVTVATSWRTAEWLGRASRRKGRLAYLIQHHETWSGSSARVDATWRLPFRRVVIARWLADMAQARGLDAVHVPNFLDTSRFVSVKDALTRPPRVAFLTSHLPWKGTDVAIAALTKARQEIPALQAVAFGTASRPPELPVWIQYFRDPPQETLVQEIYNGSAVYLCASRAEGWHLPPAEAMACGCAVVSTRIGGVLDYAEDGVTALLSPVDDVDGLASNIVQLLSDSALRRRIAHAGWEAMQGFRLDDSLDKLERALGLTLPGATR